MSVFCFILKFNAYSQHKDTRGIITNRTFEKEFQFIPYTGSTSAPPGKAGYREPNPDRTVTRSEPQLIGSLIIEDIIPAGKAYAIKYNHLDKTFTKIAPVPDLTPNAVEAINASPKWMKHDLYDNFRRLDATLQNEYAQAILDAEPLYRDEVAFQVAHLSTNMTLPEIDRDLPLVNAQGIYQIAPDLQYVKLVEYGSVESGDWHTTTSYRVINAEGDTVWREIPRDIYYWYVLMPIVYEENPKKDSTVHNEFWRTYVYNNADPGYPVLKDVLSGIKVLWDGRNYHWDNRDGNTPLPFGDSLMAVQALGRWVAQNITEDALPPRSNQPNISLHDHNGNCGEIEQLQTSGGRAALFPLLPISSLPGDHIWNEIYWPDSAKWAFYQIARVGGPTDINWTHAWPNSACNTAMRADGYRWMVNENYNPVSTVTVAVRDENGRGVDGAQVTFLAPPATDKHSFAQVNIGYWGHTDENGELTVKLGTDINYFIRADWEGGHYPANPTLFYTMPYSMVTEGSHHWIYLDSGENTAGEVNCNPEPGPEPNKHSIVVEYEIPYRVTYGGGFWDYPHWQDDFIYAKKTEGGSIRAFICDAENYYRYNDESEFDAYTCHDSVTTGKMSLNVKEQEDYYIGLSNKNKLKLAEFAKVKIFLYDGIVTSVSEQNPDNSIKVFPNPSDGIFYIENLSNTGAIESFEILNAFGGLVCTSRFNRNENSKTVDLSAFPKGIYLLRMYNKENTEVKKLILQ